MSHDTHFMPFKSACSHLPSDKDPSILTFQKEGFGLYRRCLLMSDYFRSEADYVIMISQCRRDREDQEISEPKQASKNGMYSMRRYTHDVVILLYVMEILIRR